MRIINLQCARIRQSVINETSSGEKDTSRNRNSEDKASSEEDNSSEADTSSNQLQNRPGIAEDLSQKGNPRAEPEDKENQKNFQLKNKGQNSFTPINYDNCSPSFYYFQTTAPNSYPHQRYNDTYTYNTYDNERI